MYNTYIYIYTLQAPCSFWTNNARKTLHLFVLYVFGICFIICFWTNPIICNNAVLTHTSSTLSYCIIVVLGGWSSALQPSNRAMFLGWHYFLV